MFDPHLSSIAENILSYIVPSSKNMEAQDLGWIVPIVCFDPFFFRGIHISFKTFGRVEGDTPEKHTQFLNPFSVFTELFPATLVLLNMYLFVPAHIPLLYRRFNFFSTSRTLSHLSVTSFKGLRLKIGDIKNKALFSRL